MRTIYFKSLMLVLILTLSGAQNFAQHKKVNPPEKQETVRFDLSENKDSGFDPEILSNEVIELQRKQLEAKESGNQNEAVRIQYELDRLTGSFTIAGETVPGDVVIDVNKISPEENTDALTISNVSSEFGIRGLATATEQRGTTQGRIWISYGVEGDNNIDTLKLKYSDDDAVSWKLSTFTYSNYTINSNEIDIEIIENSTGTKYIWVVYGVTNNVGQKHIRYLIRSSAGVSGIGNINGWPGYNGNVSIYKPRITSDNAYYLLNPWIYIVASRDSIRTGLGNLKTEEWIVRCGIPDTLNPLFTYKPQRFGYSTVLPSGQNYKNYCDIAYYRNGIGDSIIVTESNVPDVTRIHLMKTSIISCIDGGQYFSSGYLQGNSRIKSHARIASNGNYKNLMIVCHEEYSADDYDIAYFKSANGGGTAFWTTGYVDYRSDKTRYPDIVGRRNGPGKFYTSYTNETNSSTVRCDASNSTWASFVEPLNHEICTFGIYSQPGFRFANNDSCLTLWNAFYLLYNKNVWASVGCSGSPKVLQLSLYLEGTYSAALDYMRGDTVKVEIRNFTSPYNVVETVNGFANNNGEALITFLNVSQSVNYYISVKHRNSIETWSSAPIQFSSNNAAYDFTTSLSQAYGNNQKQIDTSPIEFGFYSGDVNQNGVVDGTDVGMVDNDAYNFETGYVRTDLNYTLTVDASDLAIVDNNAFNFVYKVVP